MGHLNPEFEDETVVVTGATSGIGRQVALSFADAGATVLNGDIDVEPKDADIPTHEVIEDDGGTAAYVETDVTSTEQVQTLVERAREYGGVDVMVNNAGVIVWDHLLDLDPDDFDVVHEVNAKGVFLGVQAAAADMIKREDPGVIINTASVSSCQSQFEQVFYDSSKAAIRMITRTSALELAEEGIRVNAVAPGMIATEFVDGLSEDQVRAVENDERIKPVPLGRAGIPDDVAPAYLYLASEDAGYVTGETAFVDGGWQII